MLPVSGRSSPARKRSSVDFPQPLGPTRLMNSPGRTLSETSASASTLLPSTVKVLETPRISTELRRGASPADAGRQF